MAHIKGLCLWSVVQGNLLIGSTRLRNRLFFFLYPSTTVRLNITAFQCSPILSLAIFKSRGNHPHTKTQKMLCNSPVIPLGWQPCTRAVPGQYLRSFSLV